MPDVYSSGPIGVQMSELWNSFACKYNNYYSTDIKI